MVSLLSAIGVYDETFKEFIRGEQCTRAYIDVLRLIQTISKNNL